MKRIRLPTPLQLANLKSLSSLTIALKASAIAVAVVALYTQDLSLIFTDALQNEATSYILVIPFLFVFLVYRKRKMLRATIPFKELSQPKRTKHLVTLSGVLLCTMAITLYWYGSHTFAPLEYHVATLPIFTAGLVMILFNLQTLRQLAFPIAFLIFLTPPPSEVLYDLGSSLSVISSEASKSIVSAIGIQSTIMGEYGNPAIIITRPDSTTMSFTVGVAYSGIYSLISFLIFAAFIAFITRDKTWKKAAIFLVGFPLVYLLNIVRITSILLIGYQYGEEAALQTSHLIGGWVLILLGTLLLLIVTEKVFKTKMFTRQHHPQQCPSCNPNSPNTPDFCPNCGKISKFPHAKLRKQDIAKIGTIAIALALLLSMQAQVSALTEGPSQITIDTLMSDPKGNPVLPQNITINDILYTLQFAYRDVGFEQRANQEASLVYVYNGTSESVSLTLEIFETTSTLPEWANCLVIWPETYGYQPKVAKLDQRDVYLLQNPPLVARYFAFQYTTSNQTQVVLYWYETATFVINNATQRSHIKISLVTSPDTSQGTRDAEDYLLPFATTISQNWHLRKWTQVAITISQNGLALGAVTAIILVSIVVFDRLEKLKTKKTNTRVFQKLSKTNRQTIEAVYQTQKTKAATTMDNIAKTYQNMTNEETVADNLLQTLKETERAGLVRKILVNQQDEPLIEWRNNVL